MGKKREKEEVVKLLALGPQCDQKELMKLERERERERRVGGN